MNEEWEVQAKLRGMVSQLALFKTRDSAVSREYMRWLARMVDDLVHLTGEEGVKKHLQAIQEQIAKALQVKEEELPVFVPDILTSLEELII